MKNLKIRTKILLGFALVVILTSVVGLTGTLGLTSANSAYSSLIVSNTTALGALADLRELYQLQRLMLRAVAVDVNNTELIQADINQLHEYEELMSEAITVCDTILSDETSRAHFNDFKEAYSGDYTTTKQKYTEVALRGDAEGALIVLEDGKQAAAVITSALTRTIESVNTVAANRISETSGRINLISAIQLGAASASVLIAAAAGLYISSLISKPINDMAGAFKQFGETGNLSLDPETAALAAAYSTRRDEIGALSSSALRLVTHLTDIQNKLTRVAEGDLTVDAQVLSDSDAIGMSVRTVLSSLNAMFSDISIAAAQVASGSAQVSDGAQSLAQGTTQQAAAVEELSGSISAVAVKTEQNADLAMRAAALAETIKLGAERGNGQMQQMLNAVKEIQEASTGIGNVIKVIDDIAFQTNILALNAAVEAARAGQQGKGFAVVAEEVRNLAAKSAEAAKNTESLIADSMTKAEFGARIAAETADSLADIIQGIAESGRVVSDIAASSEQQSAAILQINKGVEQVSTVIQANSAAAEQSAAASQQMSGQSDMLEHLVERFKLKRVDLES